MRQERWQRIDEIFHSALRQDHSHRAAFLEEACSGDMPLRLEVDRLLCHHDQASSFLEEPAIQLAAALAQTNADHLSVEGELILHYRVGAKLGSGGMGVVYQAEDLKLRRFVALKFLYDDGTRASHSIERMLAEARAASSLNHPNICTIYAIEEHRGQPVLVMELLEGQTLRDRMKGEPVNLEELIRLGMQACDALGVAHAKGIVHRDIKPANIFILEDGRLKLLDFGVAEWMRTPGTKEHPVSMAGTILYMSPEQVRGEVLDGRSDLFSLGVVLFELATRVRPFQRSNPPLTMEAVLQDSVAAPSTLNATLPASLDPIVLRMLEKNREGRYQLASEVSRDLNLMNRRTARIRLRWRVAATAAAAAAALVFVAGVLFLQKRASPPLTDKDTIVLADFVNRTGDPIFNGTMRQALEMELGQSPFLSLISDERIQHVLGLMAKPADTPLTFETAREVCERTGSAAVLNGAVSTLGNQYVLVLRAQNCSTGELLFAGQAQAARKEDTLRAISQLADKFRKQAGESLTTIAQHSIPLSEGTTPSLEAWKLFSEGMRVGVLQGHAPQMPFLKRAIEIDPHFATAQAFLGRDYSAVGEMGLARQYTQRAFNDRSRASDQERFFIDYSYDRLVTGNLEKTLETCELWTHTYPRDVLGHSLCGAAAKMLGFFDKTVQENEKVIALDADQPYAYVHLATVALYKGNFVEAQRWLDRASERKLMIPDFLVIRNHIAFLKGDNAEMERLSVASEHLSEIQDWIWGERAAVLAFSGHIKEARAMSQRAVDVALAADRYEAAAQHEAAAAVREAFFCNTALARRQAFAAQAHSDGKDAAYGTALAFAIVGDLSRAQTLTKALELRYPEDTVVRFSFLPTLRALIEIQRGNPNNAVSLLRPAARYETGFLGCCSVGFVGSLYPIYVRGQAYLALHQGNEAASEFQKILDYRGLVGPDPIALMAHWGRGQALAMDANCQGAKANYESFLSFWREADLELQPMKRRVEGEYRRLCTRNK